MPRFSMSDIDNYSQSTGGKYLSLQNDQDKARVRFAYNGLNDITPYAVHVLKVDEKHSMYVDCLRTYDEPRSKCPFCEAGMGVTTKLMLDVYDVDSGTMKVWERGKKFVGKLSSICARYSNQRFPLVSHIFEIERCGAAGDQMTTYEIYECERDEEGKVTTVDSLPEKVEVLGQLIKQKSADEMRYYLEHGSFPDGGTTGGSTSSAEPAMRRRTPGGRSDNF